MKTFSHLWQYLAEFFLEWEMFHINVLEEIKHIHFMFSNFLSKIVPFERCRKIRWSQRSRKWQYGGALHAGLVTLHSSKHAEKYEILIAFPRQKSFSKGSLLSRCAHIACIVSNHKHILYPQLLERIKKWSEFCAVVFLSVSYRTI